MAEITKSKSSPNIGSLTDTLASLKREIYSYLDQALEIDQKITSSKIKPKSDAYDNVKVLYEKSLRLTNQAIQFYNDHKDALSMQIEAVSTMKKLDSIKTQTTDRLRFIESRETEERNEVEFLDISDDVLLIDKYGEDIVIIDEKQPNAAESDDCIIVDEQPTTKFGWAESKKATEIVHIENCAQLFYIGTDGSVSTPSTSQNISIYSFEQDSKIRTKEKQISGFIRCGDWMYPLVPNDNPGMKTNFNAYIFPNNDSDMNLNIEAKEAECSFVGITFDTRTIPKEQIAFFEDILTNFNSLVYQDTNKSTDVKLPIVNKNLVAEKPIIIDGADTEKTKPPIGVSQIQLNDESQKGMTETWSADNIASSLITGAEYISRGVGTSTEYAAKYMGLGSEKLKSNLNPNAAPAKVDPSLRKVAENVRYGTHLTVRCSSYLVNKLGSLASYTAKAVAPHIREGTSHLLTKTGMTSNKAEASNTLDNICKVGGSSLKGVVMVYDSLEKAAFTLGKNFTEHTVTVVDYKYGSDAAKLAENTLYSAGNVAQTVNNAKGLKVTRTFAKATAKEAILLERASKVNQLQTSGKMYLDSGKPKSNNSNSAK